MIPKFIYKQIKIKELSERHFKQLQQIWKENNEEYNYPLPRDSDKSIKISMLAKSDFETERRRYVSINTEKDEIQSYCNITINTGNTNRQIANGGLVTLKSKRKLGIGKQLLSNAVKGLPEEIKILTFRIRSDTTKIENKPDSMLDLFLQKIGGKFVQSERRSGSKIKSFKKKEVNIIANELADKSKKIGFDLYFIAGYKFKQHSNFSYSNYLQALEGIWNDMPRDQNSQEDWKISEEMHQEFYVKGTERNMYPWTFITVHNQTKDVAGLTESWILGDRSDLVWQDDTGVVKKYRGNGLGLMLKFQMLNKLLDDNKTKDVEWWTTHNAHSNEHMLRINDKLKYEEIGTFNYYEFVIDNLKKYLNNLS